MHEPPSRARVVAASAAGHRRVYTRCKARCKRFTHRSGSGPGCRAPTGRLRGRQTSSRRIPLPVIAREKETTSYHHHAIGTCTSGQRLHTTFKENAPTSASHRDGSQGSATGACNSRRAATRLHGYTMHVTYRMLVSQLAQNMYRVAVPMQYGTPGVKSAVFLLRTSIDVHINISASLLAAFITVRVTSGDWG